MKSPRGVSRAAIALIVGLAFFIVCAVVAGIQTLILHNFDPMLGDPWQAFRAIAVLSFIPTIATVGGAGVAAMVHPHIAHAHARPAVMAGCVVGGATYALALILNELRSALQDSLIRPTQLEQVFIPLTITFLSAGLLWWSTVKLMMYRGYLASASAMEGCCRHCGYDLRGRPPGSDSQTCPECGQGAGA